MKKVTIRVVETMATSAFNFDYNEVIDYTVAAVMEITGGATVDGESVGYWKDDSGNIIKEKGQNVWTLCGEDDIEKLREVAVAVQNFGEQDCVLFIVEYVNAEFVTGSDY